MFIKMKKMTFKLALLLGTVAASHGQVFAADEPATEAQGTVCVEVDKQIYSSVSTDIDDFKAIRPGLQQISKQKLKNEKNTTLYIFAPGNIFCAVKNPD